LNQQTGSAGLSAGSALKASQQTGLLNQPEPADSAGLLIEALSQPAESAG
jgi:hypothetical protein